MRVSARGFSRFAIVLLVVLVCSANISNSFLLRWGFKDRQPAETYTHSFSLVGMMNGDAPRPFVYRSALPQGLKWVVQQVPTEQQERLFKSIKRYDSLRNGYFPGIPDAHWTPVVALTYHLTYLALTLACMGIVWLVYLLGRQQGLTWGQALGTAVGFSLLYPLTFQQGGYYYDFTELLAALATVHACLRRRWPLVLAFAWLGALNKETFFLVPVALAFLPIEGSDRRTRWAWLGLALAGCLLIRHLIMQAHAGNHGEMVQVHAWENLMFWLDPRSYLSFYNLAAKGILTPSIQNPLVLVPLVVFLRMAWRHSDAGLRRHALAAWIPLVGLYALFGYKDEVRALALGLPALLLVAMQGATRFEATFAEEPPSPR